MEYLSGMNLFVTTMKNADIFMNLIVMLGKTICRNARLSLPVVVCLLLTGSLVRAEGVAFSWQASPVEDEIVGYRLYYGYDSRLTSDKQEKSDFSYDYYIDFTTWQRCRPGSDGTDCEPLPADSASCQGLFQEAPKCTLYDFHDRLFFALTAYNSVDESGYTYELSYIFNDKGDPITPNQLAPLPAVYNLLLH